MSAKSPVMKFETERLRTGPMTVDREDPPAAYELLDDPEYRFEKPVQLRIQLSLVGDTVLIRGSVETVASVECARCLHPIEVPLRAEGIALTYMQDERLLDPAKYPDLAEENTSYYDGEFVYPAEQLRELLLLELPSVPACTLGPGDICPVRNVKMGPMVFGPPEGEDPPEAPGTSLGDQLRRLREEMQ